MHMMTEKDIKDFRRGLRVIEREILLRLRQETDCCGVTFAQCHLLLALDDSRETGIQDLSETLGTDKANISRTVDSLAEAGYIYREPGMKDRRRVAVSLTSKGIEQTNAIHKLCNDEYRKLFEGLGAEEAVKVREAVGIIADVMTRWRTEKPPAGCCAEGGN
ncbi:MAG: MarR family transcriptional regulator [Spirochaetales bacterium]|nr:MAG: MarR family transcriptional regulator [Spirochaetales bacterium]